MNAATDPGRSAVALVLGMSIHGLAIVRALSRSGIDVYAIEQASSQPSTATRHARVLYADGINSERAAEILLGKRELLPRDRAVVLYPSSDNMVRSIAARWADLAPHYCLSWAPSIDLVQHLINKANLEHVCAERDILYPRSFILDDAANVDQAVEQIGLPILVKPIRPLSGFKAVLIEHAPQLRQLVERYRADLPFLVQRWIAGGDDSLYFCSMMMVGGEPAAVFTGRKVEAFPTGTGVGTIVESCDNEQVRAISQRFVAGLGLCGPIAIEYKRDPDGRYWLIEPNVGRTEYSLDLIIQYGLNFPLIEYYAAQGLTPPPSTTPPRPVVWYDTERDPLCYLRLMVRERSLRPRGKTPIFPYFGHQDNGPFRRACQRIAGRIATSPFKRLAHGLSGREAAELRTVPVYDALPDEAKAFIERSGAENLFFGPEWFRNYETTVARREGNPCWYLIYDRQRRLCGVWPLVQFVERGRRILSVMGNYYTPYATLPFAYFQDAGDEVFASALRQLLRGVDKLRIGPVTPDDRLMEFLHEESSIGIRIVEVATVNWYQSIDDLESYYRQLGSLQRATIQRKGRALARDNRAVYRVIATPEELEEVIDLYFEVYDRSWKPAEPFPDFIRGLMRMAARAGWLRLGLLLVDGRPAASQMWLVRGRTAYIYKLAYVNEFARQSVGTLLTWHMMQSVVRDDGVNKFDYLTGNDAYKKEWMNHSRVLSRITFVNLRRPLGALFYLRERLRQRHAPLVAGAPGLQSRQEKEMKS